MLGKIVAAVQSLVEPATALAAAAPDAIRPRPEKYMKRARPPGQPGQAWKTFLGSVTRAEVRLVEDPGDANAKVVALPVLGGLHHDYRRAT